MSVFNFGRQNKNLASYLFLGFLHSTFITLIVSWSLGHCFSVREWTSVHRKLFRNFTKFTICVIADSCTSIGHLWYHGIIIMIWRLNFEDQIGLNVLWCSVRLIFHTMHFIFAFFHSFPRYVDFDILNHLEKGIQKNIRNDNCLRKWLEEIVLNSTWDKL